MVEELKLAIKIDDATVEQSLLKQFANAQKMADKVVLDFKNVNFDDKQIEAKFKEMQKKAGQNPIDLSISGNTLDMLGQIDKRLTEIFSIGKGKSFIDSSSTVADIGKIENKINELNKKYEEAQKKLSSIGSDNISGKNVNLVDNEEFKKLSQEVSELKNQFDDLKTHMQLLDDYTVPTDRFFELQSQVETTTVKVSDLVEEFAKLSNAQKALSSTPQESNISSGLDSNISKYQEIVSLVKEYYELSQKIQTPKLSYQKRSEDYDKIDAYLLSKKSSHNIVAGQIKSKYDREKSINDTYHDMSKGINEGKDFAVKAMKSAIQSYWSNVTEMPSDDKLLSSRKIDRSYKGSSKEEYIIPKKYQDMEKSVIQETIAINKNNIAYEEERKQIEANNSALKERMNLIRNTIKGHDKNPDYNGEYRMGFSLKSSDKGKTDIFSSTSSISQEEMLQEVCNMLGVEIPKNADKAKEAIKEVASATDSTEQRKDAFPNADSTASVEKIADGFKEVKQNTEQATEVTEKYQRVLSQVGELGVDAKVSAMYQRNDGQLESISWKAKRDNQGQILYDKNGNIDYDFNSTVISKYEQLEKIITTADNKLRDLQKSLKDTQNLNSNASTKNIEEQIQYQKDYIQLLEQTVKAISQQDEYLLYEQQIIDARAKAEKEYNLNQGTKSDISNAKHLASEESKRQKAIEQTNRLLNRQQIAIDNIEKSYNKTVNPDLDKSVSDASDLSELAKKKSEIQYLINQLNGQERNSYNEKEFLQLEKLISEYKQLAKDKLKANNPSKQELGGQDLKVLLEQQVSQYNQLISKAEKYGDATSDIVEKLKVQRDLIAQANSDGVYTAKSGLKADDYYSARDNYKISKAQFSSYETDIKNTERLIQAQKELGEATAKSRQSAKDATQSSVDNALQDQVTAWKNIQSIREKIAKTKDSDEIANLQQAKKEYQQNYIEADKILKANSSLYDKETQIAKLEQIRLDTNKKIADYQNKQISGYDTRLEAYTKKTSGYNATIARFNDGGWTSDEYLKNVQAVRDAVKQYATLLDNIKTNQNGIASDEDIQNLDRYEKKIKDTIATVTNMSASEKGYNFVSGQKELDKIHKLLAENSKMSSEAKAKIKAYYAEIESGNPSMSLDRIHGEIMKIYNAEVEAGRAGRSFFDTLKNSGFHQLAAQMAGMFGVYDVINVVRQGVNTVRELDEAMTEVHKVSNATETQYASFRDTISSTAKEIATTNKELLNSSADFLRLGYSLEQASDLAKNATLFVNVGDGVDTTEATEDMITAMKAFDIQAKDSIKIVDDYNQIGNQFALSASDIGEAMKRSASALETGNNSFEQSIGLITAMNEIVQNSENTGNSLKVLSLRLRGAKAELEDMQEDTDGLCDSTSKLREQIKSLTGVDIMLDDNTFKSTTDIIKELGAVWDKLSDSSQAATLELIAGKSRANNVAALLKNYQKIDEVMESLGDAEGSAMRENEAIVDSINGRIKVLSATAEEFWQNFIDTDFVKELVSLTSDLLNILTKIVNIGNGAGILGLIGAGTGIFKFIKNFDWVFKPYTKNSLQQFLVGQS